MGSRESGVHVSVMQRSRLLAAAVGALDEHGYGGGSVARITARARVSRRTFYELFDNREECLLAVLDSAVERIGAEIRDEEPEDVSWRERVRTGLWVVLSFFDREPALARVCVIQTQSGGRRVLARRQELLDRLAGVVDEGREGARAGALSELTAHGVVGAVFQIVYARLLEGQQTEGSLRDLFGDLMGMIVLPYMGVQVARREHERPAPAPVHVLSAGVEGSLISQAHFELLAQIPMRLTYRTARVLRDVGEHPGSSNRQVCERVGVQDQGQMSKLLSRLERLGLLVNGDGDAPARGEPNRWSLTTTGGRLVSAIGAHTPHISTGSVSR
jgi:AcrR family transcriptional regulator/DNA-binding MarR family transcriptional regulator